MSIDFEAYYRNTLQDNRYIFHYTNQFKAMESILNNCVLNFSTRENCHDPFEQEDIVHTFSSEKEDDIGKPLHYIDDINKVRKSVKYACFCYDKDTITSYPWDKGCFRSRMWSQYANAHQGICLVLNYNLVRDAALNEMDGDAGTWIIKVLYFMFIFMSYNYEAVSEPMFICGFLFFKGDY